MSPRRKDPTLPPRVTRKHGAYYYLKPTARDDGSSGVKWISLGKTEAKMYQALADIKAECQGKMATLLDRYRKDVLAHKAPRTIKLQTPQLEKLKKVFGHMQPDQIRPKHIGKLHDLQRATPYQANRELALISHVMKYAVRWGYLDINPCREIQRHPEHARTRYVSHKEFSDTRQLAPQWIQRLMDLAYITGQRRIDLLKIKRADFSKEGLLIKQSKTGTILLLEWSPSLRACVSAALDDQATPSTWLICDTKGQPRKDAAFTTAWSRLMNKCIKEGVLTEKFQFRDLRAKAASDSSGEQLGHRSSRILEKHYRRLPKRVKPTQ